jgi:hypothetical protein
VQPQLSPDLEQTRVLYTVFGLALAANSEIPGLTPEPPSNKSPEVKCHLGVIPGVIDELSREIEELVYVSPYEVSGKPALQIWRTAHGALLRLDYFDGVRFWLDPRGTAVWAVWPASLSLEDVATYLLGPVLGLLLRLRGVPCLHASAVAFRKFAVAFAGAEGAGKSTTAAALASRGRAVISDDIVALVERGGAFFVLPAYPYLSLWPESVKLLYGAEKELPTFSSNYDKRQLQLKENHLRFEETPMPLGAVYLLGQRVADPAAPYVETLTPQEVLVALVANSYATNLLDKKMRAREFELLGRLVKTVPVWRLRPSEDGSQIGRLCDVIDEKCLTLGQASN